jgi:hypothetical protein
MKGMVTFLHKLLATIWLIVFGIAYADAGTFSTFGDGRNIQGQIEYDDASYKIIFGYDGAAIRTASECTNHSVNGCPVFALFFNFLAADTGASETFYRTMSQEHYGQLLNTGQIPATGETFISPSLEYAQQYNGVTVQFNVQAGTTDTLLGMGVRNTGLSGGAYDSLPLVQSGWGSSSAFFKLEGNVVNVGLGNGSALNTFNNSILNFNLVPKP